MKEDISMEKLYKLDDILQVIQQKTNDNLRFGLLVPWANITMESEIPKFYSNKIYWHIARLVPYSNSTAIDDDFLMGMIEAVPNATKCLEKIDLKAFGFGCTSASFLFRHLLHKQINNIPILSAFDAICKVLSILNRKSITLITPYRESVTQKEVIEFTKNGFEVLNSVSLGYNDNIGLIEASEVINASQNRISLKSEAIVISCTALHSIEIIKQFENEYSIPVISSNSAIAMALPLIFS